MRSVLDMEAPQPDFRVQYGDHPPQFADVRVPSTKKPWPVVMNIHGGFWRSKYDLGHAGHFCAALTEAGIATFNIEYRRVGDAGGGWPGTFEDVRAAHRFLLQHAHEWGFDSTRVAVVGHSAGGQLALCLAGHESSVAGVVSLAGVLDLQQAYELHLSNDAAVEFLGGTPLEVADYYREASPSDLKIAARQILISGATDDTVPAQISRSYFQKKKAAEETVELVEIQGANHFDLIDPRTEAFKVVLGCIQRLLI